MSAFTFYSNGKLMISGEYAVLFGARAFAIPTQSGQHMHIETTNKSRIYWETYAQNNLFFEGQFDINNLEIKRSSHDETAIYISRLLQNAIQISENNILNQGYFITCHLDFNMEWGLGSSSSLISNLAYWFDIDPYRLLKSVSKGSGYDIACARSQGPLLFDTSNGKPTVENIDFNPPFQESICFVYSGKKENTENNIKPVLANKKFSLEDISRINDLSELMGTTRSLKEFMWACNEHNEIIGKALKKTKPFGLLSKDFHGTIKPLGAWGGDFFMAISENGEKYIGNYFKNLGFDVIFNIKDFILNNNLKT